MNRFYTLCAGLALLIGPASCTNDLNLDPTSSITSASYWKTESDASGALYGMYVKLRNEASFSIYALGELRSETTTYGLAGSGGYERFYENTLDATTPGYSWQGLFSVVNAANLLIKYVPGIQFSSNDSKNNILAQAYTMRAFTYYLMTRTWGDVPLRTNPIEGYDAETAQIGRTPAADIFALIKSDLDQALKLYPANTFQTGRAVWSKPAANALKADVYLWTAKLRNGGQTDLTTALDACNAVQTADVALLPSFAGVFDYANKGNREVLMAIRYEPLVAVDNYYFNGYMSAQSNPANTDAATKAIIGQPGGNNIWSPSVLVRNQFTTDDQRRAATFLDINVTNTAGAVVPFGSIIVKGDGVVQNGIRYFADDILLYRYADVLLMKAEAKNALGQDPSPEINLVRQRAYGTAFASRTYVNGTKDANDAAILKERLLELAFEGKRWWDLLRFGKAFDLVPSLQTKKGQDYLLLYPIGTATISLEPKVTQNPGY